ncbi:hypothetical protein [Streptomyces sp. NPDC050564]|uniref:hypothetical protein n=1 Tax=Streptomyces sp. NPDC050564 TaxID=3365631 RepID=UPI0037B7D2E6
MSAFYRAALLRLGLFVLLFTVIVTASKGSLPPALRALALPVACELLVFFLQRHTLARSWTASGHAERPARAARPARRELRRQPGRATAGGRAVTDPRLPAPAARHAAQVRAWLGGRHTPGGDVRWYPFTAGTAVAWAGLTLLDDGRWGWALVSFAAVLVMSFLTRPLTTSHRLRRTQRYTRADHGPAGWE